MVSVDFLKSEYGDAYRCTVLHTDELYPHLHFYAVPPSIDGQVHIRSIHCGMAARDTVKDVKNQKGTGKQRTLLYRNAMRAFQDRYFELVGSRSGLLRVGPKVRRLTRDAWRLEKQAAQRLMDANLKIESVAQIAIDAKKLLQKSNIEKAKNERDAQVNQDAEFKLTSKKNLLDEREYVLVERENKALSALHLQAEIPRFISQLDTLKAEVNTERVNLHKLKKDTSTAQHFLHEGNEAITAQKVQSRQFDEKIMKQIRVLASSVFSSSKLKYLLDKFDALKVAYSSLKVKFTALEAENKRLKSNYQIEKTKNAELDKSHRELSKSLEQERYAAKFNKKKISKLQRNFTELFVAFKKGDKSYLDKYRRDKTSSLDGPE
ncbi:hypothetical protein [Shewanella frigidimarina]|uniref:hypothetical protein n=1 Tax=Shewanella frigidimarina TaxID=56812 RepID=UPI003D7B2D9A